VQEQFAAIVAGPKREFSIVDHPDLRYAKSLDTRI
jgi:hypothetical protein